MSKGTSFAFCSAVNESWGQVMRMRGIVFLLSLLMLRLIAAGRRLCPRDSIFGWFDHGRPQKTGLRQRKRSSRRKIGEIAQNSTSILASCADVQVTRCPVESFHVESAAVGSRPVISVLGSPTNGPQFHLWSYTSVPPLRL